MAAAQLGWCAMLYLMVCDREGHWQTAHSRHRSAASICGEHRQG